MIEKFIIVLCFALMGLLFGRLFFRKYSNKRDYFATARDFCIKFSNDIGFERKKISEIIDELDDGKSAVFKNDLKEFLNGGKIKSVFFSQGEKSSIIDFFSSLGNTDAKTQNKILEGYANKFAELTKKYDEKTQKDGKLAVKLGFLGGICIGVLTI